MQGMYKSTLDCPDCSFQCVKFDTMVRSSAHRFWPELLDRDAINCQADQYVITIIQRSGLPVRDFAEAALGEASVISDCLAELCL